MEKGKQTYKLPEGWIWTTIGDVGIVQSGGTPSTRNKEFWGDEVSWITPADLSGYNEKYISKGNRSISKAGLDYSSAKLLPKGTILFSSRAPIGYTVIAKNGLATNQGFKNLIPTKSLNSEYVYYYFQTLKSKAEKVASGTTFLELSATKFSLLPFPLAPILEQQRIVSKIESLFSQLDQAEKGLLKAKQQLEVYKQALLKSAFEGKLTESWRNDNNPIVAKNLLQQIEEECMLLHKQEIVKWKDDVLRWEKGEIDKKPTRPSKPIIPEKPNNSHLSKLWKLPTGWEWTQLGLISFITKLAGFEYTKYVKYDYEGDLFVIKAENIGTNGFKKTDFSKIRSVSIDHLKRSALKGNELLIVFIGSGTGNVAVVPKDENYFLGPNVGMARPYSGINSKYLEYFFQSSIGKRILLVTAKAVAQPSLSMSTIRQSPIAITSFEEQNKIVEVIETKLTVLENIEKTINYNLEKVNVFRHSILKKAFLGKLISQNTQDETAIELLQKIKKEKSEYLKAQKALDKLKSKKKRQMEKKKTILEILESSEKPVTSKELWQLSVHHNDIETFYDELKEIYYRLSEVKENTKSFLTLKK